MQGLEIEWGGGLKTSSIIKATVLFDIPHDPEFFDRAFRKLYLSSSGGAAATEPCNIDQKEIQILKM
jgi:hypothetical protein